MSTHEKSFGSADTGREAMMQIELSSGIIEYQDAGGAGPVVVLLHGLVMDATLWGDVVSDLAIDHRCLVPTLPLGAHTHAVRPETDLSLPGIAALVSEFLDRLDLNDVTIVGVDTGGAIVQILAAHNAARIAKIVLVSCDAYDNFPPGLTGKTIVFTGKLAPRAFGMFMQQMRIKPLRRLPIAFGWLTKRGDEYTKRWIRPILTQQDIRRDTTRALRAIASNKRLLVELVEALSAFDKPALIVWASEDRVMPPEHGRRLAALLPHSQYVEIDDSYTLIPLDQPSELARAIRSFSAGAA